MKVLGNENSVLNHFIVELRDAEVQKDSMRFRKNLERIGEIMAYEISKTFLYEDKNILTPLGTSIIPVVQTPPLLAVVLRAGLPLYQGFLNYFDKAESAFIAAYRGVPGDNHNFEIKMDYLSTAALNQKVVILIDPMLATGKSLVKAYHSLLAFGKPSTVHIASVIASEAGVKHLKNEIPEANLWTIAIDPVLNDKFYISPGLGDAGDLSFGGKL